MQPHFINNWKHVWSKIKCCVKYSGYFNSSRGLWHNISHLYIAAVRGRVTRLRTGVMQFLHRERRDPESTGGCTHSATDVRCRPGRLEERCTWLRSILLRSAPHPPRPYIAQRTDALRFQGAVPLSTWACQISDIATPTPTLLDSTRGTHCTLKLIELFTIICNTGTVHW